MTFTINDSPLAGQEGPKVSSRLIARAAAPRGRGQRRDPDPPGRGPRRLRGRRPRRTAARRADRDDAARGLRARGRTAARAAPGRPADRPDPGADRGGRDRRRRGVRRPGGRKALRRKRAELVEMRPAGARQAASRVHRSVARADRLPRRVPDRHARHRRDAIACSMATRRTRARSKAGALACWSRSSRAPAVAYALWNLEDRGVLFIGPGEKVYAGHDHRRAQPRPTISTSTRSRPSSSPTSAPPARTTPCC